MLAGMWTRVLEHSLVAGVHTCIATVEINVVAPQGAQTTSTSRPSCTRTFDTYPKTLAINNVHRYSIYNIQELEIAIDVYQWMNGLEKCSACTQRNITHSAIKNEIMKITGKLIEIEKNHSK